MDRFSDWVQALEKRHLACFQFAEVRKALQALSSVYVERREKLATGAALGSAGKRAAFALYYAPLHFIVVREVVRRLGSALPPVREVIDLGCGTGAAGVAWATECGPSCAVVGYERHAWAAAEARGTLRLFGTRGRVVSADLASADLGGAGSGVVAAFTVNELDEDARTRLLSALLRAADRGARVLVVEPLARRAAGWWPAWQAAFEQAGGRADLWRFRAELPEIVLRLDHAAGLDHRELTGRTLWLCGPSPRVGAPPGVSSRPRA